MKNEQCHPILIASLMDDNIVIFATTNFFFTTTIVYSMKKYRPHMANFVNLIGLLSLQYTHPWVLFAIIHGSSMI
jgi:hypothetical protein